MDTDFVAAKLETIELDIKNYVREQLKSLYLQLLHQTEYDCLLVGTSYFYRTTKQELVEQYKDLYNKETNTICFKRVVINQYDDYDDDYGDGSYWFETKGFVNIFDELNRKEFQVLDFGDETSKLILDFNCTLVHTPWYPKFELLFKDGSELFYEVKEESIDDG